MSEPSSHPWLDESKTVKERLRAAVENLLESFAGGSECRFCHSPEAVVGGTMRCALACPLDFLERWCAGEFADPFTWNISPGQAYIRGVKVPLPGDATPPRKSLVGFMAWEGDEYVVVVDGRIVGGTLHRREAQTVTDWLRTALDEVRRMD